MKQFIIACVLASFAVLSCSASHSDTDIDVVTDIDIPDIDIPDIETFVDEDMVLPDSFQPDPDILVPDEEILPGARVISFVNQCSFPVWIKATGGNTANIGCQTQDQCPSGQGCTGVYCYCSADTQCLGTTKCLCPDGSTSCDNEDKRCKCTKDQDCGSQQACNLTNNMCYWVFPDQPDAGQWKLAPQESASVILQPRTDTSVVWSGNVGAATGCDDQGEIA